MSQEKELLIDTRADFVLNPLEYQNFETIHIDT
jgi:hypothetical protein